MALEIKRGERGLIRVFAVNRAPSVMSGALKTLGKSRLASDLLGHPVPNAGIELFPVADLAGVGLAGYLADGYAVPDAQLQPDQARLQGLDGYVLLLFSEAFEGQDVTLTPGSDLTHIATYGESQPDMTPRPLDSDAAQPYSGIPGPAPAYPPKGTAGGSLVVVGLIVLAGMILWWALN